MKCGEVGHKLEDCDTTSKDTSEALFVEEEKVQYHDDNVEKYCNDVPVFDKPQVMRLRVLVRRTRLLLLYFLLLTLHLSKMVRKL